MKWTTTAAILLLIAAAMPAMAQPAPPPDPAFLQRALTALQAQRNAALDSEAGAKATLDMMSDRLAKAEARVRELEAQIKPPSAPPEPPK